MKEMLYGAIMGLLVGLVMIGVCVGIDGNYINMRVDAMTEAIVEHVSADNIAGQLREIELFDIN